MCAEPCYVCNQFNKYNTLIEMLYSLKTYNINDGKDPLADHMDHVQDEKDYTGMRSI